MNGVQVLGTFNGNKPEELHSNNETQEFNKTYVTLGGQTPSDHPTPRPPDHPTTRPPDHPTTRPPDHPTTRPPDHPTPRPPDHPTTRPPDHPTTRPPDHPTTRPPDSNSTPQRAPKHPSGPPNTPPPHHSASPPSHQPTTPTQPRYYLNAGCYHYRFLADGKYKVDERKPAQGEGVDRRNCVVVVPCSSEYEYDRASPPITHVSLPQRQLGDDGVWLLKDALRNNPFVDTIDITRYGYGPQGQGSVYGCGL